MTYLKPGKYLIRLAGNSAPSSCPVGADRGGGNIKPVVVGGKDCVWLIREVRDATYALALEASGTSWLSHPDGKDVVVGPWPGPSQWNIYKEEGDVYTIFDPSPTVPSKAWTLNSTKPGTKVELDDFVRVALPEQRWEFIPISDK